MTDDASFLTAIQAAPGDNLLRLVYADWLDEQGRPEAEFLRLECELAELPPAHPRYNACLERLQSLSVPLEPTWVVAMSRAVIENCGVHFEFRCPKKWEQLSSTDNSTIRYCNACEKDVYHCASIKEAQLCASNGACVALDIRIPRSSGDLHVGPFLTTVGITMSVITYEPHSSEESTQPAPPPPPRPWWKFW